MNPASYFETVKQKPLSSESIKVKHMTRYNRFHNQKNDSNIHDLVGTVSKVGQGQRGQSCDVSDG